MKFESLLVVGRAPYAAGLNNDIFHKWFYRNHGSKKKLYKSV